MEHLRVVIVTWNVSTKLPEGEMGIKLLNIDPLRSSTEQNLPDIYALGFQEVKAQPQNMIMDTLFEDPWTSYFRELVATFNYVKAKTVRMQGLVLSLFCLRKHLVCIRDIEIHYTRTGLGGMWGNKGAVTIRLNMCGCSLCFVNCHLPPHDHYVNERVQAYNTILQSQVFTHVETTQILFHDYVFWFGDLNFRLEENSFTSEEISRLIRQNKLSELMKRDQLSKVMRSGDAFSELTETLPTFPPTFKFEVGTKSYDIKRRPAWTDRILHKVNSQAYENIVLKATEVSYRSHDILLSDHHPVTADFKLKVFSDHQERRVKFSPITGWRANVDNTAMYQMSSDVDPSTWDWVGLFKADFTSTDDYLSYAYASKNPVSGNNYTVTFSDDLVRMPGTYVLLYLTQNLGSVLGMSGQFEIDASQP